MATDLIGELLCCPEVAHVFVVCSELRARSVFEGIKCATLMGEPGGGDLNSALGYGTEHATSLDDAWHVGMMPANLPSATSAETTALGRTLKFPSAVLCDADGSGTALLTASPRTRTTPRFGANSYVKHVRSGARPIPTFSLQGLRRDVDTIADLEDAVVLGLDSCTAGELASHPDRYRGIRPNIARSSRRQPIETSLSVGEA